MAIINRADSGFRISQAIDNYNKGFEIQKAGGFPYQIAQCYEALSDLNAAFDYYLKSAEIRKNDDEVGISHEATLEAVTDARRLAEQLQRQDELPKWFTKVS